MRESENRRGPMLGKEGESWERGEEQRRNLGVSTAGVKQTIKHRQHPGEERVHVSFSSIL